MEIKLDINIKGLEQLTESLALLGSALAYKNNMVNTAEEAVELMEEIKEVPEEKDIKPEKEKTTAKKVDKPKSKFTREDVRAAFVSKNSANTRDKLKAILDKFNAPNISDLEEKYFEDAMKELEAL